MMRPKKTVGVEGDDVDPAHDDGVQESVGYGRSEKPWLLARSDAEVDVGHVHGGEGE